MMREHAMAHGDHILLVEDNADTRESMVMLLELEGYRVVSAANGREALDSLNAAARPQPPLHRHAAAVGRHDSPHDEQSYPQPGEIVRGDRPLEPVEDAFVIHPVDADASIAHGEHGVVADPTHF